MTALSSAQFAPVTERCEHCGVRDAAVTTPNDEQMCKTCAYKLYGE